MGRMPARVQQLNRVISHLGDNTIAFNDTYLGSPAVMESFSR